LNFLRRLRESISTSGCGSKKRKTDSDTISFLSSAYIALKTQLDLKSTGRSAICIKKIELGPFSEMKEEIENFLDASKADFELTYRTIVDPYEYLWIIIMTKTLEDNVAAIASIGDTIEERGFSDKLLASIFDFNDGSTANYLIYNYKLDKFYPFVPINEQEKRRDHDKELKIMSAVGDELPVEKNMSNWYPIWNIPI
jgi:PspA associated protein B